MNKPLPEENLGLVHLCANRFRGRGIEYDDLYSAGCIGLLTVKEALSFQPMPYRLFWGKSNVFSVTEERLR